MNEIYFKQSGRKVGTTIIFLHAIGTDGWMWDYFVQQLPDFNCLVPDLPGHGQSRNVPWVSMEHTALQVKQMISKYAGNGKAHIVGLSLGSYIGLELMSHSPEEVESAFLSGLNVLPIPNRWLMNILSTLMRPFMHCDFLIRSNAKMLHIPEDQYGKYKAAWLQVNRLAFRKISNQAADYRTPPNIGSINCPTLLVAGAKEHPLVLSSKDDLLS